MLHTVFILLKKCNIKLSQSRLYNVVFLHCIIHFNCNNTETWFPIQFSNSFEVIDDSIKVWKCRSILRYRLIIYSCASILLLLVIPFEQFYEHRYRCNRPTYLTNHGVVTSCPNKHVRQGWVALRKSAKQTMFLGKWWRKQIKRKNNCVMLSIKPSHIEQLRGHLRTRPFVIMLPLWPLSEVTM